MNAFPHADEPDAAPDGSDLLDLVADAFDDPRLAPPLARITARGTTLRRRRTALPAAAGVLAVGAAIGAAALTPSGTGTGAQQISAADASTSSAVLTDSHWTLTPDSAGGYALRIIKPGDVSQLNEALSKLGVNVRVGELTWTGHPAACHGTFTTATPLFVRGGKALSVYAGELPPGISVLFQPAKGASAPPPDSPHTVLLNDSARSCSPS